MNNGTNIQNEYFEGAPMYATGLKLDNGYLKQINNPKIGFDTTELKNKIINGDDLGLSDIKIFKDDMYRLQVKGDLKTIEDLIKHSKVPYIIFEVSKDIENRILKIIKFSKNG